MFKNLLPVPLLTQVLSFVTLLLVSGGATASITQAEDEEELMPFQEIVRELGREEQKSSQGTSQYKLRSASADPFADIWIHTGVGFVQSAQSIVLPNGLGSSIATRGVQVALGIDLLDPAWAAEGTVRTMTDDDALNLRAQLQEFDLKILYRPLFANASRLRIGAGISGRYLTIENQGTQFESVTPSSVATVGADFYVSNQISLGVDLGYRSALVADSFDRSSVDGTIRLDAHF